MKKQLIFKSIIISIILLSTSLVFSSCWSTRTNVGNFVESKHNKADIYKYSKGKQMYLFWGLIPLGRTNVATPPSGNFQIKTYYNFWDALLSSVTGGIFGMQTIKVKAINGHYNNGINVQIHQNQSNNQNMQNSNPININTGTIQKSEETNVNTTTEIQETNLPSEPSQTPQTSEPSKFKSTFQNLFKGKDKEESNTEEK